MLMVNQKVETPLGVNGIVWGGYLLKDANGDPIVKAVMVQLPVNAVTRVSMKQSNCLTPRANKNGLWVFSESELK